VYIIVTHWTLHFDGSICNEGKGIGIIFVLPRSVTFDFSSQLKTYCTNNQAKYEACLELLDLVRVKHVKVFGDLICLSNKFREHINV
jgi:ribonuclease HI